MKKMFLTQEIHNWILENSLEKSENEMLVLIIAMRVI